MSRAGTVCWVIGLLFCSILSGLLSYGRGSIDGFEEGIYAIECEECSPICIREPCPECEECGEKILFDFNQQNTTCKATYPVATVCSCKYDCAKCKELGCLRPKCDCPMVEKVECPEQNVTIINTTYTHPLCEFIELGMVKNCEVII